MLDGYIRVSQVAGRGGESFISPAMQREQIERWADANRVFLGVIFEELDESGARQDRPLLLRAIERVESGKSRGIVVAKLDRFGRSLMDGLAAIERIHRASGAFVSVQDGLDLRTETGRLVLRIMLSMAEWELDRVRSSWDQAKARAIARGVHIGRTPPFGYRRDSRGRLRCDPKTGDVARELFRAPQQGSNAAGVVPVAGEARSPDNQREPRLDRCNSQQHRPEPRLSRRTEGGASRRARSSSAAS